MMNLGATLVGTASGALAGGSTQTAATGANIGHVADTNNRQLHPDEITLANKIAEASGGQYTSAQIQEQMRGMDMTQNGVTVGGNAEVTYGKPGTDGAWDQVGTTTSGQPIYMQKISPEDVAIRALIVSQTTNSEVPSLITYGGIYNVPSYSNQPLPMPTAACGGAAFNCAAGLQEPMTQAQLNAQKISGADIANYVSTQSGRFSAAAATYATILANNPSPLAQAGAATQVGLATVSGAVSLVAGTVEQILRPDLGQTVYENGIGFVVKTVSDRFPVASPVINEVGENVKGASYGTDFKNWINNQLDSFNKK